VEGLDAELRALRNVLGAHLDREDVMLRRAVYDDDRRGGRGDWLKASHDDLRALLDFCGHACGGENHPVILARRVRDLTQLIGNALSEEEEVVIASGAGCVATRRSFGERP